MSWKCSKCGASGDPNPKGVLGFVLLHGCVNCFEIKIPGFNMGRKGNQSIGKALREIRQARGFTLRQVKKCGISISYLSQVEMGKVKEISFIKLLILCKFYGCNIKYFEQFIEDKNA